MANTLNLGSGNWGAKESLLLGYYENGGKFFPETFDVTRATGGTRVNKAGLIETPFEAFSGELISNGDFEQEGIELIANGDFSNGSTDWVDVDGSVTFTSGSVRIQSDGTTQNRLLQNNVTVPNSTYELSYEVKENNAVTLFRYFNGIAYVTAESTVGTHKVSYTAAGASLFLNVSNTDTNSYIVITNISVKEIAQDWTISTGVDFSLGSVSFNNTGDQMFQNVYYFASGTVYKLTFEGSGYLAYRTGFAGADANRTQITLPHTTYLTATSDTNRIQPYGANGNLEGTLTNISIIEATDKNLARIDYLDDAKGALLTEPQSTNLIPYSEDFSNSSWNKQSGIIPTYNTTETLSPNGTYNATKFVGNGTTGVFKSGVSVSGNISRSVYLKSVSGNTTAIFKDPNAEGGATPVNLTITNEWQRFELIGDNGTSAQGLWIDDITSDGLYMWGAQLEQLPYATSYIPTDGSTVTRNQDVVTNGGSVTNFNSEEGVLYAEIAALANDGIRKYISLSDGTSGNDVRLYYSATPNQIIALSKVGGVTQFVMSFDVSDATQLNKIAVKYKENNFSLWVNGVEVATDTSGLVNAPNTLNELAFDGNGLSFYGKTKNIQVFNTALSDSDLLSLTTTGSVPYWTQYSAMATTLNYTNK